MAPRAGLDARLRRAPSGGPVIGRAFQVALALALVTAGAAQARPGQALIFDAPRELTSTDAAVRARALDEISRLAPAACGWSSRGSALRPRRTPAPNRSASSSTTRRATAGAFRRGSARGRRPRAAPDRRAVGAGPALGDRASQRPRHRPERDALRPLRGGRRAPMGRSGRHVVDLERAQPSAVPRTAVPPRPPGLAAHLPPALPAGERACAPRQDRDRLLARSTAPRGAPRVSPRSSSSRFLCLDALSRTGACADTIEGWATSLRDAQGPWFVPPDRNDVTIGVLARLRRALDRAARAAPYASA